MLDLAVTAIEHILRPTLQGNHQTVAVAVSGGPDSLFLCHAVKRWSSHYQPTQLWALTIDHQLRPESTNEAAKVKLWCESMGYKHQTIPWIGTKPTSRIQETARNQRYQLLSKFCEQQQITYLLTAHHRDDQIETIMMRLLKGSGLKGLLGMKALQKKDYGYLVRPFLSFRKRAIVHYLDMMNIPYIQDPSNTSSLFERTTLRQWLSNGPDLSSIMMTAERLQGIYDWIYQDIERFFIDFIQIMPEGYIRINKAALCDQHLEKKVFILERIICQMGHHEYAPKHQCIKILVSKLSNTPQTLGGCVIKQDKNFVYVFREDRAINPIPVKKGQRIFWDRRFHVIASSDGMILPLREKGHKLAHAHIPYFARRSMPGILKENGIFERIPL